MLLLAAMNLLVFLLMYDNLRPWSNTLYKTIMWFNLIWVPVCLVFFFM